MVRTLRINVQVDRLPDINDAGKDWCQLGLRLSGAIVPDAATPTPSSDRDLVLPWLWRAKRGDQDGTWKVHDKLNWTLWRLKNDGSNPEKIDEANWKIAVVDPPTFDPEVDNTDAQTVGMFPKVRPFHFRVSNEISDVLDHAGVQSLEVPGADGVVGGRTVFGLVESLTGLPHPVPAGMQVWTAVSIDRTAFPIDDTDRFLAAPAFATPADVAYTADTGNLAGPPANGQAWQVPYLSDPGGSIPAATGSVQASLPMQALQIASDDNQRLIDLSALLVREGEGPAFEGTDWNTGLPSRIAETVDPAARAMAVLDTVIRQCVAEETGQGSSSTRDALRTDILPLAHSGGTDPAPDYLREALSALSQPVLAPRARSSRATAAPAAALLERLATSNETLWPAVVPLLLAHAGAEDNARLPGTPQHFVVSHARIADAAGIVPGRNDELADDLPKTIENEQAFREWLLRHWTTMPVTPVPETGGLYRFQGTTKRFFLNGNTVQPEEVKATGVVDFSRIPSGKEPKRIVIPLRLAEAQSLPAVLTFTLGAPEAPASLASVVFKLGLDTTKTELSMDGATPASENKAFNKGLLLIGITIAETTKPRALTLDLEYVDADQWRVKLDKLSNNNPIDATAAFGSGRVGLSLTSTKKIQIAVDPSVVSTDSLQGLAGRPGQGQALRSALSLAYAGPAIAGLMGGWVPIAGKTADPNLAKKSPLRERLIKTIDEYAPETFDAAFADAAAIPVRHADTAKKNAQDILNAAASAAAQQEFDRCSRKLDQISKASAELKKLWDALRDAAKADAKRLSQELVPLEADREADHVTQDAPPLAFAIDQLQDFDESVDLWTRLAGLGVLIGREGSPKDDPDEWWSLNVATLHVSRVDKDTHERQPLGQANSVPVQNLGNWPADWSKSARVDPVPLVVSEISGVRGAMVSYQSQSIVAEMQKRPQLDPRGQARAVARRPEAYLFPVVTEFPKLPPLTFGRSYNVVPYLLGHGGVVPPAFRSKIDEPASFPSTGKPNGALNIPRGKIIAPGNHRVIRSKKYLRTVPIAAPRLSTKSVWPGPFDGVMPLAAELPICPAPITLRQQVPARFFLDKEQTRGTLNSSPDVLDDTGNTVETTGIRIEIGSIDLKGLAGKLVVTAERIEPAVAKSELLRVEVTISELAAVLGSDVAGLRIDVVGGTAEVTALKSRAHLFSEDEPESKPVAPAQPPVVNQSVSQWQSFALVLQAEAADFDVEPPSVRWGALRPNIEDGVVAVPPRTFQLHGDRPIFPQEFVSPNRDIALLDGIGRPKGRIGPDTAAINLRRPATTLATYDRWVNGPFSQYGSADDDTVRKALNAAASRASGKLERGNDRSLDDPAVEAVVFEVVRLFPQRRIDRSPVVLGAPLTGLTSILGDEPDKGHGDDIAGLRIKLDETRGPLDGAAKFDQADRRLDLARGCIYELRIYGAAPAAQPFFAPDGNPAKVSTRDRFASAVVAGWRDVAIDGKRWHLGAPLVLTVEVASEIMPELYIDQRPVDELPLPVDMAFSMNLLRPPRVTRERAIVRLEPGFMPLPREAALKYAALRYLDRVALLEQRWSWRGRPHAEVPTKIDKFGDDREIDEVAKFVDTAFLGRSDDDIGTIHEIRITRAHAYGGRPTFESPPAKKAPVVLERDLDYRGGANLWRFALRAKSRYAAMRPNDPLLIRFSHRRSDLARTHWWPFIVPDRAHPGSDNRKPTRPGLMLVVPLTEPLMMAGSVPPLLALFNEPMFPLFHAGDGIESVVEVARHPFIGAERIRETLTTDFKDKWRAVVIARQELADAQAALDRLCMIDADPQPGELATAQTVLTMKQDAAKITEETYAKAHAVAVAWGYFDQLNDVRKQVEVSLNKAKDDLAHETDPAKKNALELEIKRLQDRFDNDLPKEIEKAKTDAQNVENNPSPAGDALRTGSPLVKYWPEFAPDPIRTGEGATGEPLALRCDGPVGYTFDLETEAGRFDHAGLLVSPVADRVRPWSLVKLRFRRFETPELLVGSDGKPIAQEFSAPTNVDAPIEFPISSAVPNPEKFPQTLHEGLAFTVDKVKSTEPIDLRLSFDLPEQTPKGVKAHYVRIKAAIDSSDPLRPRLALDASTQLGDAERWTTRFETGTEIELRLVVSQRPKPEGDGNYHPVADVSIRVRIKRPNALDALERPGENAWLSVICMPLTARDEVERDARIPVRVSSPGGSSAKIVVRPVRLSEFTPAVWCQFAAAMSRVVVEAEIKTAAASRTVRQAIPVDQLTAEKDSGGAKLRIGIAGLRPEEKVSKIALTAEGEPDRADAQIEERLYAVVTRYVYDAFDRLRERPLAVHKLSDVLATPHLGDTTWPAGALGTPYAQGSGRVRILRVLRGRKRDDHGFEPLLKEFPEGFFGSGTEDQATNEPFDAAGQIIGISPPFEWSAD